MYLQHFGLTAPPFRITPHPAFFFGGGRRGEVLVALEYAVLHGEGLIKVVGEVGSGKTMLCRMLLERLAGGADLVFIPHPLLERNEILDAIATELALPVQQGHGGARIRSLQLSLIERFGRGRRVVIVIDEAHAMPVVSLETIRLLSNLDHGHEKLLQIVLFGQPELDGRLASYALRQLSERITHSFALQPLHRDELSSYVEFRLRAAGYRGAQLFSPAALRQIAAAASGLTRRANILADKALLAAYADGAYAVTARHARAAVADCAYRHAARLPRRLAGALSAFWRAHG
ncbi:ExeA family protein [Jeongeupia chitinilytica]|uniref:MSHA biogenesis protein MshM n=1 Tax=Jeongeupia chitinilytica TaxID=1041641 RepID=A0ABQ3GZ86_9NEIS|nr:AAA family ATPase [Jeongeupia chitinilytica]GHD61749.1 MSHA biogenesis protein MshM [Jeongeupia chitinilytica]